jgi:hypothetical protein
MRPNPEQRTHEGQTPHGRGKNPQGPARPRHWRRRWRRHRPGPQVRNRPAHVEHKQRGQQPDPKHHAPRHLPRQTPRQTRKNDHRPTPAHRPRTLHRRQDFAAMLRPNHLRHQHRTGRPFAAKTKSLQRPEHPELRPALREGTEKRAHRKPHNRRLQDPHPPIAVRQRTGNPTPERRGHQRDTPNCPGLGISQPEGQDQHRQGDAEHLHIQRVQPPASEAGPKGPPLRRVDFTIPAKHEGGVEGWKMGPDHAAAFPGSARAQVGASSGFRLGNETRSPGRGTAATPAAGGRHSTPPAQSQSPPRPPRVPAAGRSSPTPLRR